MGVGGWILLIMLFAIYFLPTIVAVERGHHQAGMVAVLNTFLGWTLIGWVVSLSIAASAVKKPTVDAPKPAPAALLSDTRDCPYCAETIKNAAKVCKHCGREVSPAG